MLRFSGIAVFFTGAANVFPIGNSSTELLNARGSRENFETVCFSVVNLTMRNTSKKGHMGSISIYHKGRTSNYGRLSGTDCKINSC